MVLRQSDTESNPRMFSPGIQFKPSPEFRFRWGREDRADKPLAGDGLSGREIGGDDRSFCKLHPHPADEGPRGGKNREPRGQPRSDSLAFP